MNHSGLADEGLGIMSVFGMCTLKQRPVHIQLGSMSRVNLGVTVLVYFLFPSTLDGP